MAIILHSTKSLRNYRVIDLNPELSMEEQMLFLFAEEQAKLDAKDKAEAEMKASRVAQQKAEAEAKAAFEAAFKTYNEKASVIGLAESNVKITSKNAMEQLAVRQANAKLRKRWRKEAASAVRAEKAFAALSKEYCLLYCEQETAASMSLTDAWIAYTGASIVVSEVQDNIVTATDKMAKEVSPIMITERLFQKRKAENDAFLEAALAEAKPCQTLQAWKTYTEHMDIMFLAQYWDSLMKHADTRKKMTAAIGNVTLSELVELKYCKVLARVADKFKELRQTAFSSGAVRAIKQYETKGVAEFADNIAELAARVFGEALSKLMSGEHPLIKFGAGGDKTRLMPMPFRNNNALTAEDTALRRKLMQYIHALDCVRSKELVIKQGLESYTAWESNLFEGTTKLMADGELKPVFKPLKVTDEVAQNLVVMGHAKKIIDKACPEYARTEGFKLVVEQILKYALCFNKIYLEEVQAFIKQVRLASGQLKAKNEAERQEQAAAKTKLQKHGGGHFFNAHYEQLFSGSGEKLDAGVLEDTLIAMGELMEKGESFGPAYVERRLRLAYNGLRILNVQSNKRIRACLCCHTVVRDDKHFAEILKGVYDTIGESHGKDNSSWKQQYVNGRRVVKEQITKIKKSGKNIEEYNFEGKDHEEIFLIRYAYEILAAKEYARNRQAKYRVKGKQCKNRYADFVWTVPCEIDQTASCAQYYGALLGDPMLLWLTGVINTHHTVDMKRDFYAAYDSTGKLIDRNSCKPVYLQIMYSKEFQTYTSRDGHNVTPLMDLIDDAYYQRKYFKKGLQDYGKEGLLEKLEEVRKYNMARLRSVQIFIDWIKAHSLEQIAGEINFGDDDTIRYVNTKFVTYTEGEFAGQAKKRSRKTMGYMFTYPTPNTIKVSPCKTHTTDVFEVNQKRAKNYYATALIHHQDALTAAWVCKTLIKKGKFCFPIHDAFVVSPEDRQLVRHLVATRLRWVYKHRHEIMRSFFKSVAPMVRYDSIFMIDLEEANRLQREDLAKELITLGVPDTDIKALLNLHSSVWVKYNRGMK